GLAPALLLPALEATGFELLGAHADLRFNAMGVAAGGGFGAVAPLAIALALGVFLAILIVALRWLGARRGARSYETWGCGRALQMARFEYTAAAFANPFARVFAALYRSVRNLDIEFHPESRYFVRAIRYRNEGRLIFEDALYRPLLRAIEAGARRARVLQSGNVHSYLIYILATLVALLLLTPERISNYGTPIDGNRHRDRAARPGRPGIAAAGRPHPQDESALSGTARAERPPALSRSSQTLFQGSRGLRKQLVDFSLYALSACHDHARVSPDRPGSGGHRRFQLFRQHHRSHVSLSARHFFSGAGRAGCGKRLRRHGLEPRGRDRRARRAHRADRHFRHRPARRHDQPRRLDRPLWRRAAFDAECRAPARVHRFFCRRAR